MPKPMGLRVLHVASEAAPFAQSGGLADVLGGLPPALASRDLDVAVLLPLYRGVAANVAATGGTLDAGTPLTITVGPHTFAAALRTARVGRVTFGFVDCPPLYDRPGGLYGPTGSSDWGDNHLRFGLLGKVAVEHGARLFGNAAPDILHVHDWQASTAAVYARIASTASSIVTTIHNLAYRGIFSKHIIPELGWPWARFTIHDLEFYDQVSFLKGGLAAADVVTTVSPSYAQEILTPKFGEALHGFLASDVERIVGIVNGIDTVSWNPSTDSAIAAPFSADDLSGKAVCRAAIADELGISLEPHQPLIAVIARMTGQKGLDLVADIVPELHRLDAKLIVLGSGEAEYEARFRWLAEIFKNNVVVRIGFDINLSRRIYAGSDLFLMPSRFEPCGLGQLYSMRYGTIPIVHAVGGLRDTVVDVSASGSEEATGFAFAAASPAALAAAIERACTVFRAKPEFTALRRNAMSRDFSWSASAEQYVQLYRSLRTL
jgi:starch synthase